MIEGLGSQNGAFADTRPSPRGRDHGRRHLAADIVSYFDSLDRTELMKRSGVLFVSIEAASNFHDPLRFAYA
jgi:hypothetical protein